MCILASGSCYVNAPRALVVRMTFDQPISFAPHYQSRVWGGRRLETVLGRRLPDEMTPFGESWEVSDRAEAMSTTEQGVTLHALWQGHRAEVFGSLRSESASFPLLMKILDACDDLSIQVHPPASVAPQLGGDPKTEMWFIAHADPGAKIYAGLKKGVTRADFEAALQNGTLAEVVHVLHPQTGDCLFIPSGRIHAIGAGLLIYEIQQNSDTTYRVFDWNRVGLDGKPRALHIAESLASIDYTDYEPEMQRVAADGTLVSCEHFEVKLASGQSQIGQKGENLTLAVTRGQIELAGKIFRAGDFAILPAGMPDAARAVQNASADAQWLEIRVPSC